MRVGEECTQNPKIVKFLESSYLALRDIEFERWKKAFISCSDEGLAKWMQGQVEKPPAKQFDEKFNALVGIYTEKARTDALPSLTKGAIAAADNGGPFDTILMQMDAAVTPALGGETPAADKRALEESFVEVATSVSIEKAKTVADRLANAGAEDAAARLLPRLYKDRIQSGGVFLYGAAAIEAGDCGGEKVAQIHVAEVTEPSKRWNVITDVEGPMRASKPKLKKCTSDGEWAVATTPEPLKNAKAMEDWIDRKELVGQGLLGQGDHEKRIELNEHAQRATPGRRDHSYPSGRHVLEKSVVQPDFELLKYSSSTGLDESIPAALPSAALHRTPSPPPGIHPWPARSASSTRNNQPPRPCSTSSSSSRSVGWGCRPSPVVWRP